MELGIINGWEEKDFAWAASKKLTAVEFCVNCYCSALEFYEKLEDVAGYSEKYGVRVKAIGRWGDDLVNKDGSVNEETFQNYKYLIDAAERLGCPVFNMGCNKYDETKSIEENCAVAIPALKKVVEYGKEHNVKIALYTCGWGNFIVSDETWKIVLPEIPELGIKYDISHCRGRGGDYMKEMRDWGHKFYHFHLKGTLYVDGEPFVDPPMGLDDINWRAVFGLLYTIKYDGVVSLEPHSGEWSGSLGQWGIDFSIAYARSLMMPGDYPKDLPKPYSP